jgi:hypothetical protein
MVTFLGQCQVVKVYSLRPAISNIQGQSQGMTLVGHQAIPAIRLALFALAAKASVSRLARS